MIAEGVSVSPQMIALMKGLVFSHRTLDAALKELKVMKPSEIILHPGVDPIPSLRDASKWISYSLAGCEAICGLVHSGVLIPLSPTLTVFNGAIGWTTVHGRSGGSRDMWRFKQFISAYPSECVRSQAWGQDQMLADSDLYLQRLSLPHFHVEVRDALKDAVRCFRAELFTPSVVMLGKASEGAWIELGVALALFVGRDDPKLKKFVDILVGPETGFAKKLRDVVTFYENRQVMFKALGQQSGVTLDDVRTAMLWSDTLRGARNAIHHRASPSIYATYETVATLLFAAVPHLQTIHRLHSTATKASSRISDDLVGG